MVKAEQSVVINRPVEDVFAFVAENFVTNHPKWSPALKEFTQTSQGPMGTGTTIHQVREINGKPVASTAEVTEYAPSRAFSFKSAGESTATTGNYIFERMNGSTKLTFVLDTQIAGFGKLAAPMISRVMSKEMAGDLGRLKGMLES